ncbi:patatin-like phospholipase family protein [Alteromonas ponticola]|uniref:Patatin-like phospholipase family protein n=1 Tax=Alteromonas aquimaris TaxID=2998417 RepID=A0ABT3PAI6_9ALTE|nr:patatin-like phospholipase family protein [Alteromonas aquimaris]MCW8109545.1 patatin-like phospholipase family protein [Alteromonas aquimaris]
MAKSDPTKLIVPIFSGGGTRFPAHIGCLKALEEMALQFPALVGVSGGSIIAALYACGKTVPEMKTLAEQTDFKQFADFSIIRLIREGGLSNGNKFERWFDEHLNGITFEQVPVPLHILATDINGGGPVLFNNQRTPRLKVATAVRYSMSIPLVFSFKEFEDQVLVDGAILSEDELFKDWLQDGTPSVCFRLKSETRKQVQKKRSRFPLPIYLLMLIRTFMNALSREYVHAEYWQHTVIINTGNISAIDFKSNHQAKEQLFNVGYNTTRTILPRKLEQMLQPNH